MRTSKFFWMAAVALWGALAGRATAAEEFGDITGEFVTEGFVPILPPLIKEIGPPPVVIPNESYVVDKKTGGVANVFIYLRKAPATRPPELDKSADPEVKITLEDRQFAPHAVVVRTDQKLRFVNKWPRAYSIHTYTLSNPQAVVLDVPPGKNGVAIELPRPETLPMPVKCDIHPWMRTTMLVVDHPYAAVTEKDGRFTIKGLPAGEHSIRIWHEQSGYLEREWKVTVIGGKTSDLEPYVIPIDKLTTPRH